MDDVVIAGFGFSGLAVLSHLVREADAPLRITVVADSLVGHGLAYGTRDSHHLLNVPAKDMGAKDGDETDFAGWLGSPAAVAAAAELDVPVPSAGEFAPRRLFAAYLDALRDQALELAAQQGTSVDHVAGRAQQAVPDTEGWTVLTEDGQAVEARHCVLTTGNEQTRVFGDFSHPRLFAGPWALTPDVVAGWTDPVAVVGTSLTAVDAVLSLRHLGFDGQIRAYSHGGQLPDVFVVDAPVYQPDQAEVDGLSTAGELDALLERGEAAGFGLDQIIQGLRPHIPVIWQRFSTADQQHALKHLMPRWNRARHRMAPQIARTIADEVQAGSLEVVAVDSIEPEADGEALRLAVQPRDGRPASTDVAAVIDCSGTQLDWPRTQNPLLRGLLAAGHVERHPTGLGVVASDQRIGDRLYAVGSMLTGQLLETVAVPELRSQAATVATRIATGAGAPGTAARPR